MLPDSDELRYVGVAVNTSPQMQFPDERALKLLLPQRDQQFALSAKMVNNRVVSPTKETKQ